MRNWLLDRLVLSPSNDSISTENKQRQTLTIPQGEVEIWVEHHPRPMPGEDIDLLMLKFLGTAGRAERATTQPLEIWETLAAEVWAVNPPGYGQARGRATLAAISPMVDKLVEQLVARIQQHPQQRILIVANSLGNLAALRLATQFPVHGLMMRNPPPLADVVRQRSRAWKAGWFGDWVAGGIPDELEPCHNAANCQAPALFVHSELDRLVPLSMQQSIAAAYQGPKRSFTIQGAGHDSPIPESQAEEYFAALDWLRRLVLAPAPATSASS